MKIISKLRLIMKYRFFITLESCLNVSKSNAGTYFSLQWSYSGHTCLRRIWDVIQFPRLWALFYSSWTFFPIWNSVIFVFVFLLPWYLLLLLHFCFFANTFSSLIDTVVPQGLSISSPFTLNIFYVPECSLV